MKLKRNSTFKNNKIKKWSLVAVILLVVLSGILVVRLGRAGSAIYLSAKYVFPLNYSKGELAYGNGEGFFWECIDQRKGKTCGLSHPYPAMDIFAPTGTEVRSVNSGVVYRAKSNGCTRNCSVTVKGDDGNYYLYAHLLPGSVYAVEGLKVNKGQYLGKIGTAADAINTATGRGTTPHLHFDIRTNPDASCTRRNPDSPGCKYFIDPRLILFYGYERLPWLRNNLNR